MKYEHEIVLAMGLRVIGGICLCVAVVALFAAWLLMLGGGK